MKFKKHPAKGARMMAGWLTVSAVVITTAGILEDSVETVDYSTALLAVNAATVPTCLLYTSDAADE